MISIFVFVFSLGFGILVSYSLLKGIILLYLFFYKKWLSRKIQKDLQYDNVQFQTIDTQIITIYKKDEKFGFYISKHIRGISPRYDEVRTFKKKMIAVRKDNKWGFVRFHTNIGIEIREVIPPQYDVVEDFKGIISFKSKALVTKEGEQFYIKRDGMRITN